MHRETAHAKMRANVKVWHTGCTHKVYLSVAATKKRIMKCGAIYIQIAFIPALVWFVQVKHKWEGKEEERARYLKGSSPNVSFKASNAI